ncbi:hypothetical protein [Lysinibacillus xylanilyticus]|uniref:Uncharacterized protein n=1 Tax=Lysinibacillus xylanilyticus TaxID=582475 RepID=A0ABT4EQB7_9BACI|nr:hypothetical protein [Lysinibacillus xylanilyticus]MCY9546496.1 hypothetical protein [Lysinibacillus xylanilyticus]MED3802512.1 hypothetical protein [Lysinibacillus xylanilyticus]
MDDLLSVKEVTERMRKSEDTIKITSIRKILYRFRNITYYETILKSMKNGARYFIGECIQTM